MSPFPRGILALSGARLGSGICEWFFWRGFGIPACCYVRAEARAESAARVGGHCGRLRRDAAVVALRKGEVYPSLVEEEYHGVAR